MRTTLKDIANRLGISANSVSKALRGKSKISEKTRALILQTATEMNYTPNETARALVRKELRIAAVYPEGPKEFFAYCTEGIRRAATELRDSKCRITEHPFPSLETPEELRRILEKLRDNRPDALVLTCSYQFENYRSELESLGIMGIPIIYNTITGDETVPSFTGLVRINNYVSGRMAAEYLGTVLSPRRKVKKIALFVGNKNMLVHQECVEGFLSNAEKYGLKVVDIYETHEDRRIVYEQTGALLRLNPDLSGIYVTSYNSLGVCDWFDKHSQYKNVVVLGQDLYPRLNKKLKSHTLAATLFQNQFELARKSVLFAFEYLTGRRKKEDCYKKYLPQLVLGCMVDHFPYYNRLG
jgi:DNA-binding LacI/PurR family transcriptional regulator